MKRMHNVPGSWSRRLIREARPASAWWNVVKTLVAMAVWWVFFFGVLPWLVLRAEHFFGLDVWRFTSRTWKIFGGALFFGCGLLGVSSSMTMAIRGRGTLLPVDCAPHLVVAGAYCYVRNPMGLAGITQGIAVGLWHGSWFVVLYALCGLLILELVIRPWEEHDLEQRFGQPYRHYKRNVRCWIPRRTPYIAP